MRPTPGVSCATWGYVPLCLESTIRLGTTFFLYPAPRLPEKVWKEKSASAWNVFLLCNISVCMKMPVDLLQFEGLGQELTPEWVSVIRKSTPYSCLIDRMRVKHPNLSVIGTLFVVVYAWGGREEHQAESSLLRNAQLTMHVLKTYLGTWNKLFRPSTR